MSTQVTPPHASLLLASVLCPEAAALTWRQSLAEYGVGYRNTSVVFLRGRKMASPVELLSRTNPVFSAYAFYAAILVLKMMAMPILTGRQRFRKKVFANPEDTPTVKGKVKLDDPDVERVRRGHLNDLENIPIFLVIALLYTLTDPSKFLAINLFRAFTVGRILHTFVYTIVVLPQPSRAISWFVGYIITGYMAVQVILSCL